MGFEQKRSKPASDWVLPGAGLHADVIPPGLRGSGQDVERGRSRADLSCGDVPMCQDGTNCWVRPTSTLGLDKMRVLRIIRKNTQFGGPGGGSAPHTKTHPQPSTQA